MPNPPGWKELHEYKHPGNGNVRLTLFWASNVPQDPAPGLLSAAEGVLNQHGLGLNVLPARQKQSSAILSYSESLYLDQQVEDLRRLACGRGDPPSRLVVIFCLFRGPLGSETDTNGITYRETPNVSWYPFVLINAGRQAPDGLTLLHEIGHAAGLNHVPKGPNDVVANFMSYASGRTDMLRNQVIAIANSFFAK